LTREKESSHDGNPVLPGLPKSPLLSLKPSRKAWQMIPFLESTQRGIFKNDIVCMDISVLRGGSAVKFHHHANNSITNGAPPFSSPFGSSIRKRNLFMKNIYHFEEIISCPKTIFSR